MAEVHLGRDIRLGREVAIKTLRADLARDPAFQARFRREAQSAASLNHPAVVAVYDTGEDETAEGGSAPYIVMEYVDGRTLRTVLQADGRLLPDRALEITRDILGALDYSHRAGIIHRDIKPGNVMLARTGEVKVMDFGIARALTGATSTMTQTAAVVGTAQYLSPEQARGEHVDGRSDIYSTGCLLYELLTGRPPFIGDSPVAVAYQHVREDPVPPSQHDPDIPPAVDAIVLKAMAKNPANRYQSAAEMRADVDRALAGRPVEATPVLADAPTTYMPAAQTTVMRPVEDRTGRRTAAYVLLGLAVLGVFLIAAWGAKALFSGDSGSGIHAPELIGLTVPSAQARLTDEGLSLGDISYAFKGSGSCKQDKDLVCDQSPESGISVNRGDSVDIVVSKGVKQVPVPTLVGQTQDDAQHLLEDVKLSLGEVREKDSTEPAGTVLSQDPRPGVQVDIKTTVDIVVASGNAPLPDVTGLDVSTATAQLRAAGFTVTTKDKVDPKHEGQVLSMSPQGGPDAVAPRGSTITLTVGAAKPEPTATPPPTPTPGPTATP
jgi:serine/threonine-protein kinase